jgi:YHS domain-containing protein/thiol-disulfide isomerase/thioredoxin
MRASRFALSFWLIIASSTTGALARADSTTPSAWMTDFAAAETEAKRLNWPLLVHFYGPSCPPCRKMESELLQTPQVLKYLESGFIAVKVDCAKNLKVSGRFQIASMPTDLILSPDGKVLVRTEGYMGEPDRTRYLANLSKIDKQFAGKRLARTDAAAEPTIAKEKGPAAKDRVVASGDKLVPPPTEPKKVDASVDSANQDDIDDVPATSTPSVHVALDGYCPVTLRTTRLWKIGSKEFSIEHDGQTYYFTSSEKRAEFKAHPTRYAPRLLGCDPVVLAESDLAIRGSTQFGAFFDGNLFLFESAESRAKFRKTPTRYSNLKQVVKPEDVKKIASATDK